MLRTLIWWGPTGIGATFTIERYAKQHSGPFRAAFADRAKTNHICRLAEGHFGGFFGWPTFDVTSLGGYIGLAPKSDKKATMRVVDLYRRELPTVSLVAANKRGADWRKFKRDGVRFVRCPAEYLETDCAACQLCQRSDRRCVVGFTPHGSNKNSAEIIASD